MKSKQPKHILFYSTQEKRAVKGYYQYQCFMSVIQLLENLVHDGVGQIGDHRQLHLSETRKRRSDGNILYGLSFQSGRVSYSRALLMSSAARSIRALRMAERGMETCSEMEDRGGLSLSAARQDMGHSSRHRDTMESTTTWTEQVAISKTHHFRKHLARIKQIFRLMVCVEE